jgi:hypothetical protein
MFASGRHGWLTALLLLAFGAAPSLRAQAPALAPRISIDSAAISEAIAARLVTRSANDGARILVIDSTVSRWNALVRLAVLHRAPALLPVLSDSAAWYATHFSVSVTLMAGDSGRASVAWTGCYSRTESASTRLTWQLIRERGGWVVREDDVVTTGHGRCAPYIHQGA